MKIRINGEMPFSHASAVKPRFSIRPLLRLVKRLNLREKNQKMFVDVE